VQHRAIKSRIQEAAQKLGFRTKIEANAPHGEIDLVLERDELLVAIEITISGRIDYEVGNVSKCIKSGFTQIAVIGVDENKLAKLQDAVAKSLGPQVAGCVHYFLPDDFLGWLDQLPPPPPLPNTVKISGSRKSISTRTRLSPEETRRREKGIINLMREVMKNPPPDSPKQP
jgi:Holliday junction resolvase-like predicted endonuclease